MEAGRWVPALESVGKQVLEDQHAVSPKGSKGGVDSLSGTLASPDRLRTQSARDQRQLFEALQRHYEHELRKIRPQWEVVADQGAGYVPCDLSEILGVPHVVLGAIFAGKCRDQRIPATTERQKRFAELMYKHCASMWFTLRDCGVGPECAKAVAVAIAMSEKYTSLDLANNSLGDDGTVILSQVLPTHPSLTHLDFSANDIGAHGGHAVLEALQQNRTVTSVDLSSCAGMNRNHLGPLGVQPLESLLAENPVLAKLVLSSNGIGAEGAQPLARGLAHSPSLLHLDISGNDLGPQGFGFIAQALPSSCLEELILSENKAGDDGLISLSQVLCAPENPEVAQSGSASRLRVLNLGSNQATSVGTGKILEALQSNRSIEKLVLDNNEVRSDTGTKSLLGTLAANTALKSLGLAQCSLNTATVVELTDSLMKNKGVENLTLRGNVLDHSAVLALASLLQKSAKLRVLDLSSCRVADPGGAALARSLRQNTLLESLILRDNSLRDDAGKAFDEVLQTNTTLQKLILELNSMDFKYLTSIKKASDRNCRLYRESLPDRYCKRIEELRGAKAQLQVLSVELGKNQVKKKEAAATEVGTKQALEALRLEEAAKLRELETKLQSVVSARTAIQAQIQGLEQNLRQVTAEGEFEVNGKKDRLETLQQKIERHEKHISRTQIALTQFNEKAEEQLAALRAEKEKKEKSRHGVEQLSAAAERNLDSYRASLEAMADDEACGRTANTNFGVTAGAADKTKGPGVKKTPRGSEPKRKPSKVGKDAKPAAKKAPRAKSR
eukprot:gnl/MRDRNA2_/MRDRNA2_29083_c0_seq1.p1 gnl/MRDRNA2_/MRDRNA2_29083_c0~~gnl/MRDRNA2_/MRDRNA2_29083_c0_seq1.p1  ORF type:complete len:785 (+),score=173.78 gnl/MRDRNA2_/MRDRNA2_29083_c0_seq1:70-2424(+)